VTGKWRIPTDVEGFRKTSRLSKKQIDGRKQILGKNTSLTNKQSSDAQKKIVVSSIVEKLVVTYKLRYHDEIQRRKTMMKRNEMMKKKIND
jgi:hypothetical protein